MSGDVVIRAEDLGKRYVIGHQVERESYQALRDVIARSARRLGRSAMDILRGRPNVAGDHVEEFWALKNLNFEINRGEVIGVIGRNGAGKSTLLKVLSRITDPTQGRVSIRGRVASLLEVGTGFHPELSGRENIYLNGAVLGMTHAEIRRKFDEIVDFAEVEKFLDTPVKRYSSGMYVRLAFAVAAHLEPEILIVDEVLAVGDAEFQKKCLGKLGEVAGRGRTVLFVSHNMAAITELCSRGFLLSKGEIVSSGTIESVVHAYMSSADSSVSGSLGYSAPTNAKWSLARVSAVRLLDETDTAALAFVSGDPLKVEVKVETKAPVNDLSVAISIRGVLTSELMKIETQPRVKVLGDVPGVATCLVDIRSLGLTPGQYLVSVGVAHYGIQWIEELVDITGFEVISPRDKSFEMSRYSNGPVAMAHTIT